VTIIAATPYLVLLTGTGELRPDSMLVPALLVGVVIAAVAAIVRFDGTPRCAIDFAATSFIATYIGGSLASLAMLRHAFTLANYDLGLILLMATVAVVKAGDIGAYTVGRLIGRRKLAPRLSPGKTWEGALGAVAFSCLAAVVFLAIGSRQNWFVATSVVQVVKWLLFGVALSVAGMVGDLAESLLKRSAGVKDSSTWMPGFGGVLDVLDSLLLSGPVSLGFVLAGIIQA
jgi:phosphatidate cytidylyltransferase